MCLSLFGLNNDIQQERAFAVETLEALVFYTLSNLKESWVQDTLLIVDVGEAQGEQGLKSVEVRVGLCWPRQLAAWVHPFCSCRGGPHTQGAYARLIAVLSERTGALSSSPKAVPATDAANPTAKKPSAAYSPPTNAFSLLSIGRGGGGGGGH